VNALITDPPARKAKRALSKASPAETDARGCRVCGAVLATDQDWCLDCGAAAPGRLGPRPSRRPAIGVLALTLFLAGGAIAASYAAVSADSTRQAAAPVAQLAQQVANPNLDLPQPGRTLSRRLIPGAPAVALPTRPTAPQVYRPVVVKKKAAAPKLVAKPKAKHERSTVAIAPPTGPLKAISPAGASTYNPYGRTMAIGNAGAAVDGSSATAWTADVDPDNRSSLAVGVDLAINPAKGLRALDIRTPTSGFSVEVYGSTGGEPVSITDPAWTHLATIHAVAAGQRVGLGDGRLQIRHLLVWVTAVPAGMDKVALSELRPLH
jgi:hypothetical protein